MRRAPATERAGVIVGLIGSSSISIDVVLLDTSELLLAIGVTVGSDAGMLEDANEGLLLEILECFADVAALEVSVAGLDDVECTVVGVASCGSFSDPVSEEGL